MKLKYQRAFQIEAKLSLQINGPVTQVKYPSPIQNSSWYLLVIFGTIRLQKRQASYERLSVRFSKSRQLLHVKMYTIDNFQLFKCMFDNLPVMYNGVNGCFG